MIVNFKDFANDNTCHITLSSSDMTVSVSSALMCWIVHLQKNCDENTKMNEKIHFVGKSFQAFSRELGYRKLDLKRNGSVKCFATNAILKLHDFD